MRHLDRANLRYPGLWKGCVGAWAPCMGPSGSVLRDMSGCRNHGTLTNMGPETDWVVSGGKYALDLDGTNDHVLVPSGVAPTGSAARTYCGWIRTTSTARKAIFGGGANAAYQRFELSIAASNQIGFYIDSANRIYTATNVSDGNWHHIAIVIDEGAQIGNVPVYMDAVSLAQASVLAGTSVLNTGAGVLAIGGLLFGSFSYLTGNIDDIRLYNRAITSAEIKLLASRRGIAYEATRQRNYKAAAATGNRRRRVLIGAG